MIFNKECIQASQPLNFNLEFSLFSEILSASIEPNSAGKLTLVLKKKVSILWKDLFKDSQDRKKFTFKVWVELADSYPEMEMFYDLYEEYLDSLEN